MVSDAQQPLMPQLGSSSEALDTIGAAVVAVGFSRRHGETFPFVVDARAEGALERLGIDVFDCLESAEAEGTGGELVRRETLDSDPPSSVLMVGLGTGTPRDYRRAGASIVRASQSTSAVATSIGGTADDAQLAALVEGLVLGAFAFRRSSEPGVDDAARPLRVVLTDMTHPVRESVIEAAEARAAASWRSRTYALTPSNEKSPAQLQTWAEEAAARAGLTLDVWGDDRLADEGFGGILAVGSGSVYGSRFLRLDYAPVGDDSHQVPHVVIIGKGITFDSGGISIKPRNAMMTMKRDMTGAGVVIAVMGALRELEVGVTVTGLVASAENAFGAASMRPGDIVTHYGGRTSEVGNTDAEGRLVLADALAYADQHIDASAVVDVATLTGAGKVALGTSLGVLFANDDGLATALRAAGEMAGEPVWRLPLSDEYESLLENTFADATNAAKGPGAITAALFLQHFVGDNRWAHLDIASVGDAPKDAFEYSLGATGFGARLLLRWLEGLDAGTDAT